MKRETDIDGIFQSMPKIMYKFEPFEFYGGNYAMSQQDKKNLMHDQIYKHQEVEIVELKKHIQVL